MKYATRFVNLHILILSLLSLSGCASMKISDIPLIIREPAKKTCFEVKVLSWEERVYDVPTCDRIVERGIILTSEAWKMLRSDIQSNCQTSKCKKLTGAADGLFLAIDQALQKVPLK